MSCTGNTQCARYHSREPSPAQPPASHLDDLDVLGQRVTPGLDLAHHLSARQAVGGHAIDLALHTQLIERHFGGRDEHTWGERRTG